MRVAGFVAANCGLDRTKHSGVAMLGARIVKAIVFRGLFLGSKENRQNEVGPRVPRMEWGLLLHGTVCEHEHVKTNQTTLGRRSQPPTVLGPLPNRFFVFGTPKRRGHSCSKHTGPPYYAQESKRSTSPS